MDFFGERALLIDEPRSATAQVSSETCEVMHVEKKEFEDVVNKKTIDFLISRARLQNMKVEITDLEQLGFVGSSSLSLVRLVENMKTKQRYALKKQHLSDEERVDQWKKECDILSECDHPFVAQLVRVFEKAPMCHQLLELVPGNDLDSVIKDNLGPLNAEKARFYVGSMLLALDFLHGRKILYRDLKPENIVLDSNGYIKLVNFAVAKRMVGRAYTPVGTPHYMAPEMITSQGYMQSADFWSLGVCMFSFLTGELPFGQGIDDQLEVCREILGRDMDSSKLPGASDDGDAKAPRETLLVCQLLAKMPEKRLGCGMHGSGEVRSHKFFLVSRFSGGGSSSSMNLGAPKADYFDDLLGRTLDAPFIPPRDKYASEDHGSQAKAIAKNIARKSVMVTMQLSDEEDE